MKCEFNNKTARMEPVKRTGVEVTARMGGLMVEDLDRHIQFLINYGNGRISHCVGCNAGNLHIFDDIKSRKIAERVKRIGAGKGIPEYMSDFRFYSINYKDFNGSELNGSKLNGSELDEKCNGKLHVKRIDEM